MDDSLYITKCQMCHRTMKGNNFTHPDYGLVSFDESGTCVNKLAVFDVCQDCLAKIKRVINDLTTY